MKKIVHKKLLERYLCVEDSLTTRWNSKKVLA